MNLEINPFETPMALSHPEPNRYQLLDKLLQIMEEQPKKSKGRFAGLRSRNVTTRLGHCFTNTCTKTFMFNCSNHCRLCENTFCDKCSMLVSPETIIVPLHKYQGHKQLRNTTIKVCQACNERVQTEWQMYSIDLRDGILSRIQKLDDLKKHAEWNIDTYNTAIREAREGTRHHKHKRLHQMRDQIDSILDEYDKTLYTLVRQHTNKMHLQYNGDFDQYRTDLDRLKRNIYDDLSLQERSCINVRSCFSRLCRCCCCCCFSKSTDYDYMDNNYNCSTLL
ncbi:uncharacterized protein [Antedon mediterranea]|uniref:uncharacterized protein n=1 Tax=Antedon mediterranea TaxID=105859 RepID=UPI003AF78A4E